MTPNTITFTALASEYCQALEGAPAADPREFTGTMLRLLPRIYITAADLDADGALDEGFIDQALDEDRYEAVRAGVSALLGEYDTYLEVFEEDMKYSDTPIAASISELLADLYQVFYNYIQTMRDAPEDLASSAVAAVKDDFATYWSQTLCNVLRPLNNIYYNS